MGRLLRIGLERGGKVIDERLLPMGVDVTIGHGTDNTFVVSGDKIPKSTLVFKADDGDRHLILLKKAEGWLDKGDGRTPIEDIVAQDKSTRRGKGYAIPIGPGLHGRLFLGDLSILFQYKDEDLPRATNLRVKKDRPMVFEAELSWEGTVLSTLKVDPIRPLTVGPVPTCDFQVPGRVFGASSVEIVTGANGQYVVDLRHPKVEVDSFVGKGDVRDVPGERIPISPQTGPFVVILKLPEGFELELRYHSAMRHLESSAFDIEEPLPFISFAGSALFHVVLLLIAFTIGAHAVVPQEVKEERRRELSIKLQEHKIEAAQRQKDAAAEAKSEEKAEAKSEKPKDEPKKEAAKPAPTEPRPSEPRKEASGPAGTPKPTGTQSSEERRAAVAEGVRQRTFLSALGGSGDQGASSVNPVGRETEFASAFEDIGSGNYAVNGEIGDTSGTPGVVKEKGAGDGFKKLSDAEKGGKLETAKVDSGSKGAKEEAAIKVNVRTGQLGSEGGLGKIDSASVAAVFSRRKGAIKACYERELRRNDSLRGRITIRFTIGTAGRITAIAVTQNTTGDDAIADCITSKVNEWKFDPPSGGAVTFTYPFILEKQ